MMKSETATGSPVPKKRRRWLRCLVSLTILLFLAYCFRAPILRSLAYTWIIDTPPTAAAAIVVLGGGLDTRPYAAAKLYHAGYAPVILIARVKPSPTQKLGLSSDDTEIARQILLKSGVPESSIQLIGTDVTSTYEEAQAVLQWAKAQATPPTLLIPTEIFCTRRTQWIFQKILASQATVTIVATPSTDYTAENWWHSEEGLIQFQNEVIKDGYYHWKY